jgi:AraC family transcriptional regulator
MVPGTITIVPKGRDVWRRSNGSIELSSVFLGNDRLYAAADQVAHGQRPELFERVGFDDPRLFGILGLLSDEVQSADPSSKLFLEQLIDLLCLQLLRAHSSLATPLQAPSRCGLAAWQVKRVTDYMRENLDQNIELQELADLVGLSRYHFCHTFRRASGHTPHGWLTRQRIARARELLSSPRLRIVEVALAVGYQTPSAFASSFRRVVGKTPTEYRRALTTLV